MTYIRLLFILLLGLLTTCAPKKTAYQGYIEGEYLHVSSNFSGILQKRPVSRGDQVKKGQLLYMLDSEPEASELKKATQDWEQAQQTLLDLEGGQRDTILESIKAKQSQAEAAVELSEKNLQRYKELFGRGYIDKATLDEAQSNYDRDTNQVAQFAADLAEARKGARDNQVKAQLARVESIKAAAEKAQWALAQKSAYAPRNGMVFDTYYKVGEFVNAQQPVLSLLVGTKLIFYIPEPKRSILSIGEEIYFTCDGCTTPIKVHINFISPQAEYTPPVIFSRESRQKLVYRVEAKLSISDAKRLYPGQPVDIYLK